MKLALLGIVLLGLVGCSHSDPHALKPTLTPEQIATLQNFYADDVALYAKVQAQP